MFSAEREAVRSETLGRKNFNVESAKNMTTSTPETKEAAETSNSAKGLFGDYEDDDLFGSSSIANRHVPEAQSITSAKKVRISGKCQ